MRSPQAFAVVVLLSACASAPERPGAGAAPVSLRGAHYSAPADTLHYGFWQQQTLYYVRGRDTLRLPGQTFLVRAQEWSGAPNGLHITQQRTCVGAARCELADTFVVSPRGHLIAGADRVRHVLMPLPEARQLTPGTQWADSAILDSAGIVADVHRTFRVQRVIESQGRSLAEIVADGTFHLHGDVHSDSIRSIWIDVSGPMRETHWFDVRAGVLVSNFVTARLSGWGTIPNASGGVDTLPAGLILDIKDRSITAERAHLLVRALPGRDSSVTMSAQTVLFLHTVRRDGDEIDAGLARPDGWVRTATEHFQGGRPLSYDAVWSDTSVRCCTTRHIERRGDSLYVRRETKDTTVAVPQVTWAVCDAMTQEFLVPVLLTLPRDNAPHPVAIYRPYDGKWTVWQAAVRETEGVYVIRMSVGAQDPEELLVVTKSGDLLFAEQPRGPDAWMRMPPPGTMRRAALEGLLKRLAPVRNVASQES
jgi:hypothetical protein